MMLFKDLKPGYPVYVLRKKEGMKVAQGKTINVSGPYFPKMTVGQMDGQTAQRVVDVTVETEGKTNTYAIPETLSVTYADGLVLSTDREGILRDVEAMKSQSEEIIRSVEKHRGIVADCERIMEEWNPAFAEKREQDKRISGLESEVKGLGEKIALLLKKLE